MMQLQAHEAFVPITKYTELYLNILFNILSFSLSHGAWHTTVYLIIISFAHICLPFLHHPE